MANALGKNESDRLVFDPIEIGNYMPLNTVLVVCRTAAPVHITELICNFFHYKN